MRTIQIIVFSLVLLFSSVSCSNLRNEAMPSIKYELSGGAGHYDYAPSFIIDEYGIIYGFLCENRDPFEIVDYIYLYKGIPTPSGYVWQPGTPIIAPSETGWDNCHICDPDVRKFKTTYKGEQYDYIMTYLGVDQWDCNHNQIGLALSKNIEGPWIKFEKNPIIPYTGRDKWGTGQSTTIVLDSTTVLIGYHSTTENGPWCYRKVKMDDLDNIVLGEEVHVPFVNSGNCYPAFSKDKIFTVTEIRSPEYDKQLIPTWVGDRCVIKYKNIEGGLVAKSEDEWTELFSIGPEHTGFPRNHNPGFLTDVYGWLPENDKLVVYFTTAVTGSDWLWSYDLRSATFNINDFIDNEKK